MAVATTSLSRGKSNGGNSILLDGPLSGYEELQPSLGLPAGRDDPGECPRVDLVPNDDGHLDGDLLQPRAYAWLRAPDHDPDADFTFSGAHRPCRNRSRLSENGQQFLPINREAAHWSCATALAGGLTSFFGASVRLGAAL
jgi:hypothetical protein